MNKKPIKIIIILLILTLCIFWGYQYYLFNQATDETEYIETVEATRIAQLKSTISATGTIEPVNSVEVSSKITARIKEVLVKENENVTAGQIVAILDGKEYEAKRNKAQFNVTNNQAKYERVKYLHSIGAKSDEELDNAILDYNTSKSDLEEAESDLAETVIIAPISGTIVGKPKTAGSMATQGSDYPTVIMRIADLSSKQIKAKIDETDIGSIKSGQSATFTVDAYTGKTFNATVSTISRTDVNNSWNRDSSNSNSSSDSSASVIYYYVMLEVNDPEELLLPAMTARVEIDTLQKQNVLVVDSSAVQTDINGSYVILVNPDKTIENRYIKTGISNDDYIEVLEGLSEGDKVAIDFDENDNDSSQEINDFPF